MRVKFMQTIGLLIIVSLSASGAASSIIVPVSFDKPVFSMPIVTNPFAIFSSASSPKIILTNKRSSMLPEHDATPSSLRYGFVLREQ